MRVASLLGSMLLFFTSCSVGDLDCDWTWIEEESCLMDVCAEQGASDFECRHGDCWCCDGDGCWNSVGRE